MPADNKENMSPLQILESIPEGVFAVDPSCQITYFNQKAEEITGYRRSHILGKRCADVFRTEICESRCIIRRSISTGKEFFDNQVHILDRSDRAVPIRIQSSPLRDREGNIIGGLQTFQVVTDPDEGTRQELILFELRRKMGRDERLARLYAILPDLAGSDAPVLLQGEPGTEKRELARAIHLLSGRALGPYCHVSCREKDPETLTRELLGTWKHPGGPAGAGQPGSLERAHRGTLFLEEIEELPYPLQVSLFKAMEEGEYRPPGAESVVSSDIRLIASTQADLEKKVKEGTFPQSLFYCLNVFKIQVPALRDRREDILTLARDILWRISLETGKEVSGFDAEVARALQSHPFPGNIHELDEILRTGHASARDRQLKPEELPALTQAHKGLMRKPGPRHARAAADAAGSARERILGALIRNRWNRKRAAQELGVDRTTLWRRMKRMGIRP
ncbi:MAG: sigma 54-interacting transcriptional regulator [bacterium]